MKRRYIAIMTVVLSLLGLMMAGCGEKPEEPVLAGEEVGEYYCDADGKEYTLSLTSACEYTLVMGETELSGKYVPSGETVTLSVAEGTLTATYYGDVVRLEYAGQEYRFLRKIDYTVTFDTNGGGSISEQSVRNGRTAQKPEDPKKTGEVFVGWYTDSTFKSTYSFKEPVTSNLKLYARFVQPIDPEFTVSFDVNGGSGSFDDVETVGHKLFSLPTPEWAGHTFVGWWVSGYGEKSKLTYQYKEQLLEENTTLYAVWAGEGPAVSVEEDKIVWTSAGTNVQYRLAVKNQITNQEETFTLNETEREYRFAEAEAGDYEITVTVNGKTGTAYYRNKGLSKVTVFKVENNTLLFNGVDHATSYLLTVECGTVGHHSGAIELGAADEDRKYDFSQCEMKEGAITFTVTAQAEGYLSSTSEPYKVTRTLAQATGMQVDKTTETLTWTAVDNATSYDVVITQGSSNLLTTSTEQTTLALKNYNAGTLKITITPKARGWNSPAPADYSYDKLTLATPADVHLDNANSKIVWEQVAGAKGYEVKIGSTTTTVSTNEVVFDTRYYESGKTEYPVTVRALGEEEQANSLWTEALNVRYGTMGGELRYENKTVTWDPVFGVENFIVKVGTVEETYQNVNTAQVEFTQSGQTEISVYALYDSGERSEPISVTVTVYELSFDTQSGEPLPSAYYVKGDSITLPQPSRTGYSPNGWYTAPEDGQIFDDKVYKDENDRKLYANWTANHYHITFVLEGYGVSTDELTAGVDVVYGEKFNLPVPESNDVVMGFIGWYTQSGGGGTKYTDFAGQSANSYTQAQDMTVYAYWLQLYTFTPQKNGSGAIVSYQVSKSVNLQTSGLTTITIPATYKDAPVTSVIDFTSLTRLETIRIPDSIRLISVASTESAFTGCGNLKNIEIYETEYVGERFYSDEDGVLLYRNAITGEMQLKFYPKGRAETVYTVPSAVQVLPAGIFSKTKLQELIIPANVTLIEAQAIEYNLASTGALTKVTFLAADEGEEEHPLTLRPDAFHHVTKLTALQLPARTEEFNFSEVFTDARVLTDITVVGTGLYTSIDGLLCKDLGSNGKELAYWPQGRKGEFTVPAGVLSIGSGALQGNSDLTTIYIPGTVEKIGAHAFEGCMNVTSITFQLAPNGNPLTIEESAFQNCNNEALTELELPSQLVNLGTKAFVGTNITRVIVYSGWLRKPLHFEAGAFSGVTYLYLGPYVEGISFSEVFGSALQEVEVSNGNNNYESDDQGVLYTKNKGSIAFYPDGREGKYILPTTVTALPANIFNGKENMTEIELHSSLTEIGDSAFANSGLQEITIPASVTRIGKDAFYSTPLNKVEFTPGSTGNELTIGATAFQDCSKLTTVAFPERLTYLGPQMFQGCSGLISVSLPSTLESIGKFPSTDTYHPNWLGMFNGACKKLEKITVAEGNTHYGSSEGGDLYLKKQDEATGQYYLAELMYHPANAGTEAIIEDTTERIWSYAFNDLLTQSNSEAVPEKALTTVKFKNDSAKNLIVDTDAFVQVKKLSSIQFPHGTSIFRYNALNYLPALASLTIPNTVTSIGIRAFEKLNLLKELIFEDGEIPLRLEDAEMSGTSISSSKCGVFSACPGLTEIVLPERTSYIGIGAFKMTHNITSVTIPSTVETIASNAFAGGTNLNTVNFVLKGKDGSPSKLKTIGDEAFSGRTKLTGTITFPASLQTIGFQAFNGCTGLTGISFEDNSRLETLSESGKNGPFYNCSKLASVNFGKNSSLKYIYTKTFYNCIFASITLPATVEVIGNGAFENCKKLTKVTFEVKDNQKSNLREVQEQAFKSAETLASFSFPETEEIIKTGTLIFDGCKKLENVHLSSTITSIDSMFKGTSAIKKVTIAENNPYLYASEGENTIIYSRQDHSLFYVVGKVKGALVIDEQVTKIGAAAFQNQTELTSVVIPAAVETIGSNAFDGCSALQKIEFKTGIALREIGTEAFKGCTVLASINFENAINLLRFTGNNVFSGCVALKKLDFSRTQLTECPNVGNATAKDACSALIEILLPASIESLDINAFNNATSLLSVDLSRTKVTSLPAYAFSNCTSLTEVRFPQTLATMSNTAFTKCSALQTLDLSNTVLNTINGGTNSSSCFSGCTELKSVIFPASFQSLGNYTFYKCTKLGNIDLGNAQTIGKSAFEGCTSLSSVDLASVVELGSSAFNSCGFTELTVPASLSKCDMLAFAKNTKLVKVTFPATLGAGSVIGDSIFSGCTLLSTVVFEPGCGLTALPKECFKDTKLQSINLKDLPLESLGANIFQNCSALESIELPDTITEFGSNAFSGCKALKSIKLPANVTALPGSCFSSCTSLATIEGLDHITSFGNGCLSGTTALTSVTLDSTLTYDKGSFKNCKGLTEIDFGDMTTVPESMFEGCDALEEVTIPYNITSLGNKAFASCTGLVTVDLHEFIESFGDSCFDGCTSLKNIDLETLLVPVDLSKKMFEGCTSLTSIGIPVTTASLGDNVFEKSGLTSIDLSALALTSIPTYAFHGCADLQSVTLPQTLTQVLDFAFNSCTKLASIELPESVTKIGKSVFMGCSVLTTINLGKVQDIGEKAFQDCVLLADADLSSLTKASTYAFSNTGFTSFTIPAQVTLIGSYFFKGCTKLQSVTFLCGNFKNYTSSSSIPNNLFENCTALSEVKLPEGLTEIGTNWFSGCTELKTLTIPFTVTKAFASNTFNKASIETLILAEGTTSVAASYDTYLKPASFKTLKTIVLPASITKIDANAFKNLTADQTIYFVSEEAQVKTALGEDAYNAFRAATKATVLFGYQAPQPEVPVPSEVPALLPAKKN